jgi:hypothetical protein
VLAGCANHACIGPGSITATVTTDDYHVLHAIVF